MALKKKHADLELRIQQLLQDEAHQEHPLQLALAELWRDYVALVQRIGRITDVSDAYQAHAREKQQSQAERLEKQMRQLEKVSRISDRYQKMMGDLNSALKQAATHDSLTGLANRRLLQERLRAEVERSKRGQRSFCVAMIDIDHFKLINDQHGHEKGDQVLVEVARVLEAEMREYDLCGRWGGEEFLILLPDSTLASSELTMQRVRLALCDLRLRSGNEQIQIDVSVGLAQHAAAESYSATINRADQALYRAKRNGRGRIEQDAAEPE